MFKFLVRGKKKIIKISPSLNKFLHLGGLVSASQLRRTLWRKNKKAVEQVCCVLIRKKFN